MSLKKRLAKTALPPGAAAYEKGPRKWLPIAILSLAVLIIVLDTTILNVSLKTIVQDLGTDIQGIQWVITGYSLTLAAMTITGGRLGDLFGRKKMFVIGALTFATGSLITSLSTSIIMMQIGTSIICGLGAAFMMPATASLLVSNYSGRDRALAFGIWGGVAAAGMALGPVIGGFLTTNFSWRWGFRINLFVVVLLLVGSLFIAESRDREEKNELDGLGVLLSATGLLALVFGVIKSADFGWWIAKRPFAIFGHELNVFGLSITPLSIAAGLLILGLFVVWQLNQERRGRTPLVSMRLFLNKQFTAGASVSAIMALGQLGVIFAVPVFLQAAQGLNSFQTGLSLLPMSLALLVGAPSSSLLSKYITPKRIVQMGLLINVLATTVLRQSITVEATTWQLAPGLALFGLGTGFVIAQVSNLTLSAVSVEESGEASGVNNTFRQIGVSFGSAIIGAALVATLASGLSAGIHASDVIPAEQKAAMAQAVSARASEVEFGGVQSDDAGAALSPEIERELNDIAHRSSAAASSRAIMFTSLFSFAAFLVASRLPNVMNVERNESVAAGH